MVEWYVRTKRLLRALHAKAADALAEYEKGGEKASATIHGRMRTDFQQLKAHWLGRYPNDELVFRDLDRHIGFGMGKDYSDIMKLDLPALDEGAEARLVKDATRQEFGFEDLLHPAILAGPYKLYLDGHMRGAVMDSITLLFEMIRTGSNCRDDGDRLAGKVSTENPILIFSELESEAGQNDQKGFMQILSGAYQVVSNPNGHSVEHDLNPHKAAQYLVFSSLLARRIDEAKAVRTVPAAAAKPART